MSDVLVVVPHPDDESYGMGGTIAKFIKTGNKVDWLLYFAGVNCRGDSQYPADLSRVLGLGTPLSVYTNRLDNRSDRAGVLSITQWIEDVVESHQLTPDTVYMPSIHDLNIDHQQVARATLAAFRPLPGSPVRCVLSYEVPSATEWGFGQLGCFRPSVYEDITDTMVAKIAAIQKYGGELREYPHPRSVEAVRAQAMRRGSEVGVKYAEAFELVWERR